MWGKDRDGGRNEALLVLTVSHTNPVHTVTVYHGPIGAQFRRGGGEVGSDRDGTPLLACLERPGADNDAVPGPWGRWSTR